MEAKKRNNFIFTGVLFFIAILFTILVKVVDVQPIGPEDSMVGFAKINQYFHDATDVHMIWYKITEVLGILTILTAVVFAGIGLLQLIQRRSLALVDKSIYILAGFYVLVLATYVLFEIVEINYRPILMEGELEASYPSSHTLLVACFMFAVIRECGILLQNEKAKLIIKAVSFLVIAIMIMGRLVSGVHWFTDIVGGLLISAFLCMLYHSVLCYFDEVKYDQTSS